MLSEDKISAPNQLKIPSEQRRVNNRVYTQLPSQVRRPRGVSSPQTLNRSLLSPLTATLAATGSDENINLTLAPRVNNLRPNLSPQRPNLSPLSPNNSSNGRTIVNIPTPVNMVERLTPTLAQAQEQTRNLSPMSRFLALARKLSPRSNQNQPNLESINSRLHSSSLTGTQTANSIARRRHSPSYNDNKPQSLFPPDMKDASTIMNKLLASKPPINHPSPAMRRIRNLTPKLLLKVSNKSSNSGKSPRKRSPIGSSPLSKPPITSQFFGNSVHKLPMELLTEIFSYLYSPSELIVCAQVCKRWKAPAIATLNHLIKVKPYADLPMLQTLRQGLNATELNLSSPANLHQVVDKLSVEYCHSNPLIYPKFYPKNPETMVNNLFWIFLFLDREFRSPSRRRVSCDKFIKLVHRGIFEDIDKNTLKSLYYDIKATALVPLETNGTDNDNDTIYITSSNGLYQFLPHPVRRWWRRITHRGLGLDGVELDNLSDVEEEDPFRTLE